MTNTAEQMRDAARARFLAAKPRTRAWREAEEDDLNFWQGKVAMTPPSQSDAGRR